MRADLTSIMCAPKQSLVEIPTPPLQISTGASTGDLHRGPFSGTFLEKTLSATFVGDLSRKYVPETLLGNLRSLYGWTRTAQSRSGYDLKEDNGALPPRPPHSVSQEWKDESHNCMTCCKQYHIIFRCSPRFNILSAESKYSSPLLSASME